MKKANIWQRLMFYLKKPLIERINELKTFGWHNAPYQVVGTYVDCPMESGKRAILMAEKLRTASGDSGMWFIDWIFIKYVHPSPQE